MIACYSTGSPAGPSGALISSQSILLTIVAAITDLKVPSWMQLVGLVFGIIGAFTLTVPDKLIGLLRCIFCCGKAHEDKKVETEPAGEEMGTTSTI